MSLTPKQERFVEQYIVDLNATQAAIRAGYSPHTARQQGDRLLTNVDVSAAVAAKQAKRSEATGITAAWALERLKREAEFDGEGSSHSARVSALGLAMKHLGMLTEDAPHPDRQLVDMKALSDDALDRILAAVAPLLAPELRALGGAGEGAAAAPG